MTLEELQKEEWYKGRPEVIKQAVIKLPPITLYKFKESGKQCYIISFEEPESGKLEDVTCTVEKTGIGENIIGLNPLDTNIVFGVKLDDLEPWDN